jgi:endonuclease/exonuclease/phosphatase family metal-dependent hydrolase
MLRVMTWNICHANYDKRDRTRDIIEVINGRVPDRGDTFVVALQEAVSRNATERIVKHCGLDFIVHGEGGGDCNVAIVGRGPIHAHVHTTGNYYNRPLVVANVVIGQDPVPLAIMHLHSGGTANDKERRNSELADILCSLGPFVPPRHLIIGDFNFYADDPGLGLLHARKYVDCQLLKHPNDARPTYPGLNPPQRFDYIFASPAMTHPTHCWVLDDSKQGWV